MPRGKGPSREGASSAMDHFSQSLGITHDPTPVRQLRGRLFAGSIRGAGVSQGGIPTPDHVMDADEHRFGDDARFIDSASGQMSMDAGDASFPPSKEHVDHAPYAQRAPVQGHTMPMFGKDEPSATPTDQAQHYVQLMHPHLAQDYKFGISGNPDWGHSVEVTHTPSNTRVGSLSWAGRSGDDEHAPGEINMVSTKPESRAADGETFQHGGKGIATAMWDFANVHVAQGNATPIVHSSNRSTQGNHWAHFVGGATMARTNGMQTETY